MPGDDLGLLQRRAQGVTIVYISHRMEEIFELADRVSVNLEGPTTQRLSQLAPQKMFMDELLRSIVAPTLRGTALAGPLGDSMQAAVKTASDLHPGSFLLRGPSKYSSIIS